MIGYRTTRRLTYVITSLGLGGAQQQVASLARCMLDRGWVVDVVSLLDSPATTSLPIGIPARSLGMRRRIPDVRGVTRLAAHLSTARPDVVHSHMLHANLVARMARLLSSVPVLVSTAHNTIEGGRWVDLAYRLTDRLADLTTNVSREAVARYVRTGAVPAHRIRYVANGIDVGPGVDVSSVGLRDHLLEAHGVLPDRFLWFNAGRLAREKDLPTLLEAFRILVERDTTNHLLIAGDGDERTKLEQLTLDLGLQNHTTFLGYRPDVPQLLRAVDAFAMSSAWEGLPMILLEASAARLPVVATRVGGTTEIVIDGTTGFVVEPRDPRALAQAMGRLRGLRSHERAAMGQAAHDHVERTFSLSRVADTWESIYTELLGRRLGRMRSVSTPPTSLG